MIDSIAQSDERMIKVSGPVATGKTEALIRRAIVLLKGKTAPESILVIVATSFAAQAFRTRLRQAAGPDLAEACESVRITTALELCAETLSDARAQQITGRTGRLITKFEYNFILEDMKTIGQSRRELRSMLGYFYRNWAAATPEKDWRYGDALEVSNILVGYAKTLGGVIEQEAPSLCADLLKSPEGADLRARFAYVLADDFQNLSHAEQIAVCLHADKQIIVAGNENQVAATGSKYPYPEGFAKFEALRRGVKVFALTHAFGNARIQKMAAALADKPEANLTFDEQGPAVDRVKWTLPSDEIVGLTKVLRDRFNKDYTLREHDFCFVVPNKRIGRMFSSALAARGFKVSSAGMSAGLGGDPRDLKTCPALVAYTKLNLIAKPDDAMAWRVWLGLGDYLCNSQSWAGLYKMAESTGMSVLECLESFAQKVADGADEPFLRSHVLSERYLEGKQLIGKHDGRKGFNLLSAIGASGLDEFKDVEESMTGEENAEELFELIRASVTAPTFPENPHVMRMASYGTLAGTGYDNIFAVALVDGYMPSRDAFEVVSTDRERAKILANEKRAFYGMCGKAKTNLCLTYFTKCDLELAERTKMQVSRIRSEEGQRIALSRPSCFFIELDDACPTTVSGQSYLAERELI